MVFIYIYIYIFIYIYIYIYIYFWEYIKMSEIGDLTYYQKTRDLISNKKKYYYKNNKERFREQARDKYRSLSEEEKK